MSCGVDANRSKAHLHSSKVALLDEHLGLWVVLTVDCRACCDVDR